MHVEMRPKDFQTNTLVSDLQTSIYEASRQVTPIYTTLQNEILKMWGIIYNMILAYGADAAHKISKA